MTWEEVCDVLGVDVAEAIMAASAAVPPSPAVRERLAALMTEPRLAPPPRAAASRSDAA